MIRRAIPQDIDALIALGREMHAESWYAYLPFDGQKLSELLPRIMDSGYLAVYVRKGEVVGGIVGALSEFWFCRELVAHDLALFIRRDARGSLAAVRLVQGFEDWARGQGVEEISLSISTGVAIAETGSLFEALGLHHVGGVYKRRLR